MRKDMLTTNDVAKILEVTPGRARQMVVKIKKQEQPELPSTFFGAQRVIQRKDLEQYIAQKGIENPRWDLVDN